MTLSDKDRKILWGKAGNQCSYRYKGNSCKQRLVEAPNGNETVVGFECHIIGKTDNSARYLENFPQDKMNSYENIILLCGSHHKLIDDKNNDQIYTIPIVRKIKKEHEYLVSNRQAVIESLIDNQQRNIFQRLYDRFEDPYSPNLGYELANYLQRIRRDFLMCLSMNFSSDSPKSNFYTNDLWSFCIIQVMSGFIILIDDYVNKERYDYHETEKNKHVLSNWLRYFRTKCEDNGLIIFE